MLKTTWNKIKNWSGWTNGGTIFMRRMEVLGGLAVAGVAGLSQFDFMPFITGGPVDWSKVGLIAGYLVASGAIGEGVRRWNTETKPNGQLVPKAYK